MKKNRQLAMLLCGILCMSTIASCGGSWMVSGKMIKDGKFDEITELVKEAAQIVKECR